MRLQFVVSCVAVAMSTPPQPQVSFWYGPGSYGGEDMGATVELLRAHRGAVTNLLVYCGHSVGARGLEYDAKLGALCLESGLLANVSALGIAPEIVVDSGSSNVTDYRRFFANASANIAALAAEGRRFGAAGIHFDLEPQKGSPASTTADSILYAAFLRRARAAFAASAPAPMRTTVAVAEWCPMTKNYAPLAAATDRLMDMETYNADSMRGWLQGDAYGGYYGTFERQAGPGKGAPGMGAWNQSCGDHACWSTTAASGAARLARAQADGVREVAVFRIVQQNGAQKMPQDWWWPLLEDFVAGRNISSDF
eukprot:g2748.t1